MSQLENWSRVHVRHTAIMDFIHWMEVEYNVRLDYDYCTTEKPAPLDYSRMVDEFLGVNRAVLDDERRAAIESARKNCQRHSQEAST